MSKMQKSKMKKKTRKESRGNMTGITAGSRTKQDKNPTRNKTESILGNQTGIHYMKPVNKQNRKQDMIHGRKLSQQATLIAK